jgi:DNA-binding NtrC family response regulator
MPNHMLRAMQANPVFRDVPVIVMSSLAQAVVMEMGLRCFAFLRKPFGAAAVRETVARALDSASKGSAQGGARLSVTRQAPSSPSLESEWPGEAGVDDPAPAGPGCGQLEVPPFREEF